MSTDWAFDEIGNEEATLPGVPMPKEWTYHDDCAAEPLQACTGCRSVPIGQVEGARRPGWWRRLWTSLRWRWAHLRGKHRVQHSVAAWTEEGTGVLCRRCGERPEVCQCAPF